MGDNRATIYIKFEIYGYEAEYNSSHNFYPEQNGVDESIEQFFKQHYESARAKWEEVLYKEEREREKAREAKARKALFLELKKEFEDVGR